MEVRQFLNDNVRLISEIDLPKIELCIEGPFYVIVNQEGAIKGCLNDNRSIIPVGTSTFFQLENDSCNWTLHDKWVITDDLGELTWISKEKIFYFYHYKYKQVKSDYELIFKEFPGLISISDQEGQEIISNIKANKNSENHTNLTQGKGLIIDVTEDKQNVTVLKDIYNNGKIQGQIRLSWQAKEIENISRKLELYTNLELDLKALFESSFDVIYVSDGNGVCLRSSAASGQLFGYNAERLIGRTCYELEQNAVFRPSITRLVLERKEKVQAVQTTKTGKRLMVVGTPIKDKAGNIVRVVNISRDITNETKYKIELEDTKNLMEGYKRELEQLRRVKTTEPFVYHSKEMQNVISVANKVARVDSTVLILGDSGVGKEVVANYIHYHSPREHRPFIKINCGAIPDNLLESELFGYEKGAFTGASSQGKAGIFEVANDGTLFLDEIGETPLSLQVKLLRVIQEKEFTRIGSSTPIKTNVRIITATNRDLLEEVNKGTFRKDLFFRLNVLPIKIPPLKERRDDILKLTLHFLDQFNQEHGKVKVFLKEVLDCFQLYDWPGNVRELQNIVERLIIFTDNDVVYFEDLPDILKNAKNQEAKIIISTIMPFKQASALLEEELLKMAREKYGTTTKMATVLGVNQSTISRKLGKRSL